jgi:hypothetical protein
MDWNVGRLLRRLQDLRLADNTVVLYFSDNGPNSWRWNGGMKGRKGSTDEGGLRVPCLVRWPGHVKAGTKITEIAGAIDLLPTLTDIAGISSSGTKPLDGRTLKPLLIGSARRWPERMIFSHQNGRVSVRTQRYRLDAAGMLFDMVADPGQDRDISKDRADAAVRLSGAVAQWRTEVLPKSVKDDRPFPVGYPAFPEAPLPARDGVPSGNIRRSANAPNCSYFTNWSTVDDGITWDIEVATSGQYEAFLYYTCARENVGSTVELSFNGSRVTGKVSETHDPPLVGAQFDRVPREGESYVKDFRPLRLGVLSLMKGRGELVLRALDIPGKQVMDLRAVSLVLIKP